jgi:hypothetical protein
MKDDEIIMRIETFDAANGGGVGWYEDKGADHLYLLETEAPIARPKPVGTRDEVRPNLNSTFGKGILLNDMHAPARVLPLHFWVWLSLQRLRFAAAVR